MDVIGVDISKYNAGWNPDNATKPISFVIQRVSYGTQYGNYVDQQALNLYSQVMKIPVRGAYHYYSSYINWKVQADFFLNVVKDKEYDFYAVDYEKAFNVLNARTIAEYAEFIKYLKAQTGKKVLAYFNQDVFINYIKYFGYGSWAANQDVWIAQYPWVQFLNLNNGPSLPAGITNWKMWQYGAGDVYNTAGYNAGVEYGGGMRGIDLNLFHGSFEDLLVWSSSPSTPPVPVTEPTFAYLLPRYVPNGPAIIAGSDAPRQNHPIFKLGASQQTFINKLNNYNLKVMQLFYADDVGPTKGMDLTDMTMKYIPAGWSGNVVKSREKENGWVKVDAINLNQLPNIIDVNRINTPWLVHRITTVGDKGQFIYYPLGSAWNIANDPLFSPTGYMWLPMEWVKFFATTNVRLNVRSGPSTYYSIRSTLPVGSKLTIYNIGVDVGRNVWGKIGANDWVCLKYGAYQYTDWNLVDI